MSNQTIEAVLRELELLPESDRQQVLAFLAKLRLGHLASEAAGTQSSSSLHKVNGLLVFTGKLQQPGTDWLELSREEREQDIITEALARLGHP